MKGCQIVGGDIFVVRMPFRFQFRHATADRKENTTIFLKLTSSTGAIGWGETLTRSYLTGETEDSVVGAVQSWWCDLKKMRFTPNEPTALLHQKWREADAAGAQAAWSLVDIAVRDLWMRSQVSSSSVVSDRLYPVTFPVGLSSRSWFSSAGRFLKFRNVKFKTDRNIDATIRAIRTVGSHWEAVSIDANGCFRSNEGGDVRELISQSGANYIEEPFALGNHADTAALVRDLKVKVVADESLRSFADAQHLIKERSANVFNIRLAKVGGITGAIAIGALAREHGIGIQLGALVGETGLLGNAARLCLGRLAPELVEYSFPSVLLAKNPVGSDIPFMSPVLQEISYRQRGLVEVNESKLVRNLLIRRELG